MTELEKYRQFAADAPDLPLFMQPWYLDAVCENGAWQAALAPSSRGGRVAAVMPYFLKRKWGWRYVAMPVLGKFHGPYLLPQFRNPDDETRLYEALLDQLPPGLAAFEQDLHYGVTNWLPYYWRGFRQTTRYSYVLSLDAGEVELFQNIARNYRQKISKAGAALDVTADRPLADLYRLLRLSFGRQELAAPFSFVFLQKLHAALADHDACRLFFAADKASGALHSAALLVWDKTSAYYLLSGDDPALRNSGSAVLLKWEAIRYAKNVLRLPLFDFEGSMIRAVEQGRRDFGARQKAYFRVMREWSGVWKWGKTIWR